MTVAFSTSSPICSVALFDAEGTLLDSARAPSEQRSSEICLRELSKLLPSGLGGVNLYCADIGPGSFTGTRVGVMLAKTLAYANGAKCAGLSAFDLIDSGVVAFPSKKDEYFVRRPGLALERTQTKPSDDLVGFGFWFDNAHQVFPDAARFGGYLNILEAVDPIQFVPQYAVEPSISQPKKAFK